jgi:hypothetical protein
VKGFPYTSRIRYLEDNHSATWPCLDSRNENSSHTQTITLQFYCRLKNKMRKIDGWKWWLSMKFNMKLKICHSSNFELWLIAEKFSGTFVDKIIFLCWKSFSVLFLPKTFSFNLGIKYTDSKVEEAFHSTFNWSLIRRYSQSQSTRKE